MSDLQGWYGFDFDGTLAEYDRWRGATHTGHPIPKMVDRLKKMLDEGKDCRIFTARIFPLTHVGPNDNLDLFPGYGTDTRHTEAMHAALAVQEWCAEHIGRVLPITCVKDYGMIELYDDRCKQVIRNTGVLLEEAVGLSSSGAV